MIQLVVERYTEDGGEGRTLGPLAFLGVDGAALTNEYDEPIAVLDSGQWHTQDDGQDWGNLIIESVPATAPNLLAACEAALEMAEHLDDTFGPILGEFDLVIEMLQAAIAKAKGEKGGTHDKHRANLSRGEGI
jgi:hypothetical protein